MEKITLKAESRELVGKKVSTLRKEGKIPAVMYGHKIASQNILVNALDFRKAYDAAGESAIIELTLDDKKKVNVLVYDLQTEPLSGNVTHIDFFQVRMDEEVETEIPLNFIGEAPIVKEQGGILVKGFDAIPVKCLPADLPGEFEINLESLTSFESQITVADLKVSDKVKIMLEPETMIVTVSEPRGEEELAKLDEKVEIDVSQVETTEKKEKEEVEGEPAK